MADERQPKELSDIANTSSAKTPSSFQSERSAFARLLPSLALFGSIAAVYYGWFIPEHKRLEDYAFCMRQEIRNYRNLIYDRANVKPLSRLRGPLTGENCVDLYTQFQAEE